MVILGDVFMDIFHLMPCQVGLNLVELCIFAKLIIVVFNRGKWLMAIATLLTLAKKFLCLILES